MKNEFPKGVFPAEVEEMIDECVKVNGFNRDILCCAFLTTVSSIVGNKLKVKIQDSWHESICIWVAIVGFSGLKKSPAIKTMMKPILDKEAKWYLEYMEVQKEQSDDSDKPKCKQIYVDDATFEALVTVLSNNPNGVVLKKDELMTLIKDSGRYSGASQLEKLMSIFSGEDIRINRKGDDYNELIVSPFVNIIGGIQNKVVDELFKAGRQDNGFVYRFLFCKPESPERNMPEGECNEVIRSKYYNLVNRVFELPESQTSKNQSRNIHLSPDASIEFKSWQTNFIYKDAEHDEDLISYKSKMEANACRIALILETATSAAKKSAPVEISKNSMENAIRISMYFIRCYLSITKPGPSENVIIKVRISALRQRAIVLFKGGLNLKEIIVKTYNEGYRNSEINQALGVPKATISLYTKT
ncbi:MAG: hypothetical protein ACI9J3_000035 [Parvicellaceae bacterium]|jgi:hypothetical protein